jgi:hypothetical protein
MKKSILIIAISAICVSLFPSCNKCTTCTKNGGSISTVCRNSYSSDNQYNAAIQVYENTGYNCN